MEAKPVIIILTTYLVAYVAICYEGISAAVSSYMFVLSPFLLVCCVYLILKDDSHKYPELGKDEEWGYRDKAKAQTDIF